MTMCEHSSKYSTTVNFLLAVNTKLVYMFAFEIQTEDIYIQICLSGWLGVGVEQAENSPGKGPGFPLLIC